MTNTRIVLWVICCFALLLGACSVGNSGDELEGKIWVLAYLNGTNPIENHEPTLNFKSGQVSGNTGCNHYGGTYRVDGDSIQFEDLYNNEMACLEPKNVMEQEQLYVDLLRVADRFEVSDDKLTILTATEQTLIFVDQMDDISSDRNTPATASSLQLTEVVASASTPTLVPPFDLAIYQDQMAGVMLLLPKSWVVTSVIEGQSAIFQSYPEDKYIGGEMLDPGDTKCDLNIHSGGVKSTDIIKQWQSDAITTIVSEEEFNLQSGLKGRRFVIDGMGRSTAFIVELDQKVILLTCFGDFTPVDVIATTIKANE